MAINGPLFFNLSEAPDLRSEDKTRLRILLLGDNKHCANVVADHINAFVNCSRHEYIVFNPIHDRVPDLSELGNFDAIVIHYSLYILGRYFLPSDWAASVSTFKGLKVQIIQDEHRFINAMNKRMDMLGISLIFSSLEPEVSAQVYSKRRQKSVHVYSCLPGYVADYFLNIEVGNIASRPYDIVYRGRVLPASLGSHALEKKRIGDDVLMASARNNLKVDISSDENDRIYGKDWINFLSSGKATLGVEGGASIFDFDGSITKRVANIQRKNTKVSSEFLVEGLLKIYDGNIVHKTITPKIFEAIATKTALILYPGKYRGILVPGRHYIELQPDGSNMDEVLQMIRDIDFLQQMVDRAYEEVLLRSDLAFKYYVQKTDDIINRIYNEKSAKDGQIESIKYNLMDSIYKEMCKIYFSIGYANPFRCG